MWTDEEETDGQIKKKKRNGRFRNATGACVNAADLLGERRSCFLSLERLNHTLMCSALRRLKLLPRVKNSDTCRKNEKKDLEMLNSYGLDASQEITNDANACKSQTAFSKKEIRKDGFDSFLSGIVQKLVLFCPISFRLCLPLHKSTSAIRKLPCGVPGYCLGAETKVRQCQIRSWEAFWDPLSLWISSSHGSGTHIRKV